MSRRTPVRCVLFDAVGTLIHPEREIAEIYHRIASRYGSTATVAELKARFRNALSSRTLSPETSEEIELEFWRETVRDVIGTVRDEQLCFQELHTHFAQPQAWRLATDAEQTVIALQNRGIKTAIASNFDSRLNSVQAGITALQAFDHTFISSQLGWRKPHPAFFEQILKTLQLLAEEVLMVGDSLDADIIPAKEMGMQTLHLVSAEIPGRERREDSISSLTQILERCSADA